MNKELKIIAIDIDGTLLNSKKELTDRTKSVIKEAQEQGVIVVLATGRPSCGAVAYAEALELKKYGGYLLSYNGGSIACCKTDEQIFNSILDPSFIPQLYNDTSSRRVSILSYQGDCIVTENADCKYVEIESRINNIPIRKVDCFVDAIILPVVKCIALGEPDDMATLEFEMSKKYGEKLSIFRSEPFFVEFTSPRIDKGESLNRLMVHLGMTKDNLIAFGDGFNDLTMIEYAGVGVAMSNAQEVLKDIANVVAPSNDEDGVACIIEKLILGK